MSKETKVLTLGGSSTTAAPPKRKAKVLSLGKKAPSVVQKEAPKPVEQEVKTNIAEESLTTQIVPVEEITKKKRGPPKEEIPHVNVVFVGHVDAGKSTISGQLMIKAGLVDERQMEKLNREAADKNREGWGISYIMDQDEREREKGKTVDTGAAHFKTDKRRFTILDAPGHSSFIPSMLAGGSQADIAVLVISARKGEFEAGFDKGGQTREHAILIKTLGVRKLIVAVNKMDDPSVEWSSTRFNEISSKLSPFLKQVGYPESQYTFIPISGLCGHNIKELATTCDWYNAKKTLLQAMEELPPPGRSSEDAVRFPIYGRFKDEGKIHIHGKVESGQISVGDKLQIMPGKIVIVIEGVTKEHELVNDAYAGDHCVLKTSKIEEEDVHIGDVLGSPSKLLPTCDAFHAHLMILERVDHIITSGYNCVMHLHALTEEVTVDLLATINKKTGKIIEKFPSSVRARGNVMVRIHLPRTTCLEESKNFGKMGSFVLRDKGKTIACGVVTKVLDNVRKIETPK